MIYQKFLVSRLLIGDKQKSIVSILDIASRDEERNANKERKRKRKGKGGEPPPKKPKDKYDKLYL